MLTFAFHSCWAHWSYYSLLVQRSPCSSPVGYLRRTKVAKVMCHTLLGGLSCTAVCGPMRKRGGVFLLGKPCWSLGWWLHPRLAGWVQPSEIEFVESPPGSEQPLLWVTAVDLSLAMLLIRMKSAEFRLQLSAPKEIIQLKQMQLPTSLVYPPVKSFVTLFKQ